MIKIKIKNLNPDFFRKKRIRIAYRLNNPKNEFVIFEKNKKNIHLQLERIFIKNKDNEMRNIK